MRTNQSVQSDFFGFLPVKLNIDIGDYIIEPIGDYDKVIKYVKKHSHIDGYIYPPTSEQWKADPITLKPIKRIPRTKKPAHLYRIPASHKIIFRSNDKLDDLRKGPLGFLIHLLGYLYGTRLQFYDWWFDGRIPIEKQHNITVTDTLSHDFLSKCYIIWNRSWARPSRTLPSSRRHARPRARSSAG